MKKGTEVFYSACIGPSYKGFVMTDENADGEVDVWWVDNGEITTEYAAFLSESKEC